MRKGKRHIPLRTCISCRAVRGKKELTRLVVDAEGRVVRDKKGKARGRGAYVCESRSCLMQLGRNTRLNKAFRKEAPLRIHPGLINS